MEDEENPVLKQAMEELSYLSGDPDFKRLVESRARFIRIQNTEKSYAREEGKEEGRKEEKIEIAKKLLLENIDIEKISKITELSIEEIEKLKK